MAVNVVPLSAGKVETYTKEISTARTGVDEIASPSDGVDLRLLFTAGTNGGFYDSIEYQVFGTGTQAAFNIYIWETDSAGANARIVRGYQVEGGSAMSNTVIGQKNILGFTRADLQPGVKVWVSQSVVSANCKCNYTIRAGQYEAQ
jgi:peptidoglycan hydrolase-like protein with peptidoglycan-binding domain